MKTNEGIKSPFESWEIGIVAEPMFQMSQPNGKPFEMIVIAHRESYFIINTRVFDNNANITDVLLETFIEAIEKGSLIPSAVFVKNKEHAEILRKIADKYSFEIKISTNLKAVSNFVRSAKQWSSDKEFAKTVDIDELYFEAMDMINNGQLANALKLLNRALKIDPHYVQTHVGLSSVYRKLGDQKRCNEHIKKAYEETLKIFKTWPEELSWYDMDNRKYHRAIFYRAGLYIESGDREKGLELYIQLLKMWPNDNQGVRYYAAGVYAGKSISEINDLWDRCNDGQNWDKIERLLSDQNKKHNFWTPPKE